MKDLSLFLTQQATRWVRSTTHCISKKKKKDLRCTNTTTSLLISSNSCSAYWRSVQVVSPNGEAYFVGECNNTAGARPFTDAAALFKSSHSKGGMKPLPGQKGGSSLAATPAKIPDGWIAWYLYNYIPISISDDDQISGFSGYYIYIYLSSFIS